MYRFTGRDFIQLVNEAKGWGQACVDLTKQQVSLIKSLLNGLIIPLAERKGTASFHRDMSPNVFEHFWAVAFIDLT